MPTHSNWSRRMVSLEGLGNATTDDGPALAEYTTPRQSNPWSVRKAAFQKLQAQLQTSTTTEDRYGQHDYRRNPGIHHQTTRSAAATARNDLHPAAGTAAATRRGERDAAQIRRV